MTILDELGNPIVRGRPDPWVPEDVPQSQQPDYGWTLAQYTRQQRRNSAAQQHTPGTQQRIEMTFRRNREEMEMLERVNARVQGNAPQSSYVVQHTRSQVDNITRAAEHRGRAGSSTLSGMRHQVQEKYFHVQARTDEKRRKSSEEAAELAARARGVTTAMNADGSNYRRQDPGHFTPPAYPNPSQSESYPTRHREQVVTRSTNYHLPSYHVNAPYSYPGVSQPPPGQNMGHFDSATAVYYHPGPNAYASQQGSEARPTHVPTPAPGAAPGQYYYPPPQGYRSC